MIITIVSAAHGGQEEKRLGGGGRGAGTVAAAPRPTAVRGLTSWAACTTDPPLFVGRLYQATISAGGDILGKIIDSRYIGPFKITAKNYNIGNSD